MNHDPIERQLFVEGIRLKYGYDFRGYSEASLDRRLHHLLGRFQQESLLGLLGACLGSHETFRQVLPELLIGTSEFFRDPAFFRALREQVFPVLETHASLRIWIAGCSTGEEVLSLCIGLQEQGLLRRSTIYATDINPRGIEKAKEAIYPSSVIPAFTKNYVAAGGAESPSDYYSAEYGLVQFDRSLLKNVTFFDHNMVTDETFVEAHLILCRNVLIYFNRDLQDKVLGLFGRSLTHRGFLGIGSKESIRFTKAESVFEPVVPGQNLFVKKATLLAR